MLSLLEGNVLVICSYTEGVSLPKIDLMFVVSAQAPNSLSYIKDVIADIMQNYSTNLIHYAVVVYGDEPSVILKFSDGVTDPEQLASLVRSPSNVPGGSALDKALQTAKRLFGEDSAVRPGARKVLVVITDEASSGDKEAAKGIAKDFADNLVTIITVAVGDDADHKELEDLTPKDGGSLNTTIEEDPGKTGEKIIQIILEGK